MIKKGIWICKNKKATRS